MDDAGVFLTTLISPKEAGRQGAERIIGDDLFTLIYVDALFEVCEQRDPKGYINSKGWGGSELRTSWV